MLIDDNDDDVPLFEFPRVFVMFVCSNHNPVGPVLCVLVDGKPADQRDGHSSGSQDGDKVAT